MERGKQRKGAMKRMRMVTIIVMVVLLAASGLIPSEMGSDALGTGKAHANAEKPNVSAVTASDDDGNRPWTSLDEHVYEAVSGRSGSPNECDNPHPDWIFCDDFEQDRLSEYFEYVNPGGNSFVRQAGSGMDSSYGMKATWTSGQSEAGNLKLAFGRNPVAYMTPVDDGTADYQEIYWRYYVKHDSNWNVSDHIKLSRAHVFHKNNWAQAMTGLVWAGGTNNDYLTLDPTSYVDSNGIVNGNMYNDPNHIRWLGAVMGTQPLFSNSYAGQWYAVEARIKMNSPGQSNGIFEVWIDDQLEVSITNMDWVGIYNDYGINALFIENYINAPGPTQTTSRYIDNLVVSTSKIGLKPEGGGTPGPAPINECANPKAAWIFCDDFEQNRLSDYFEYIDSGGNFVRSSSVGRNGSYAMKASYLAGQSNAGNFKVAFGQTPQTYVDPVDDGTKKYREIYWRMYVKNAPGWTGGGGHFLSRATSLVSPNWAQSMLAQLISGAQSPDHHYLNLTAHSGTDSSGQLQTTSYNQFANMRALGDELGTTPIFDANHVGEWYSIEARVKLNDPGQSNGVYEVWINDELEVSLTNLNWVGNYDAYGINAIFFENVWTGGAPQNQERYLDNIVISTERIGASGNGGDPGGGNPGNGDPICEAVSGGECYYIAAEPGTGSGTFTDPFRLGDLPKVEPQYCIMDSPAVEALGPGDVLYFRGGTYDIHSCDDRWARAYIHPQVSGTSNAPVTFSAYPGETVVLNGVSGEQPIIGSYYTDYVKIKGFIINPLPGYTAIMIFHGDGAEIGYNQINGGYYPTTDNHDGIRIEVTKDVHVHHNVIQGVQGDHANSAGIKVYWTEDLLVEHNYLTGNYNGVYDKNEGRDNVYRYNFMTGNSYRQFYGNSGGIDGIAKFIIHDNVIDGDVELFHLGEGHQVYDNLIRNVNETAVGAWNKMVTNNRFWNNVVLPNSGTFNGVSLGLTNLNPGIDYLDYNFYVGTPSYKFNGTTYTLSQMRALGYEQNAQVLSSATDFYVDQTSYEVKPAYAHAGRYGDTPGPDNVAQILDLSRYGPQAMP